MPQEMQTTGHAALWTAEQLATAERLAQSLGIADGEDVPSYRVHSLLRCALFSVEARDYHRREIIADGFIYDPEAERIYDLVADVLPPARPAADLIDGFDFEGMDWGDGEPAIA